MGRFEPKVTPPTGGCNSPRAQKSSNRIAICGQPKREHHPFTRRFGFSPRKDQRDQLRRAADRFPARALPPFATPSRPSATAAGLFPSSGSTSGGASPTQLTVSTEWGFSDGRLMPRAARGPLGNSEDRKIKESWTAPGRHLPWLFFEEGEETVSWKSPPVRLIAPR